MRRRVRISLLALSFIISLAAVAPASASPVGGETLTVSPR